jgi:hypothetical protein
MPIDKTTKSGMPKGMLKSKRRGRDLSTPLAESGSFDPIMIDRKLSEHDPRYVKAQKSYDSILKVNPKKAEAFRKKKNNTTHSDGTGMYIEPGNVVDRTIRKFPYYVEFKKPLIRKK